MEKAANRDWLWVVLILLVASWLGAGSLNADILFVDEYWSIRNSGGDPFGPLGIVGIWERTATVDPGGMGVLYHWLLAAWEALAGTSPFTVRAFSLLAGLLTIAGLYRLGAALFSPRVGVIAAVILGTSAFFVDYLHEGRAYTLIALWAVVAVYAYHRAVYARAGFASWLVMLALALAALAYTHYVALAMGAALGLYHLAQFAHCRSSRRWWSILGAMAMGGLLFLPWLGVTLEVIERGSADTNRQGDSMTAAQIVQNLAHTLSNANLALLALLVIYSLRQINRRALLIWAWLVVCLVLVILVNALIPFMVHLRYLMLVWPAAALLMALGIWHMRNAGLAASLVMLVWAGAGVYQSLNPAFIDTQFGQIYRAPADGFDTARHILDERGAAGDLALFHIIPPGFEPFNYFVLGYYMDHTPFRYDQFERMNNSFAGGDNDYLRDVQAVLDGVPAVWTMQNPALPTTQRSGVVAYALRTAYASCGLSLQRDDMLMALHVRPPATPPIGHFAQGDSRIGLHDLNRAGSVDHLWRVALAWDIPVDVPPETYSIAVFVLDEGAQIAAQADVPLPNQRPFACTDIAVPLDALPAGDYSVQIVVYDWQTGERLAADDGDAVTLAQPLSLVSPG